jgi:hypothetical protein
LTLGAGGSSSGAQGEYYCDRDSIPAHGFTRGNRDPDRVGDAGNGWSGGYMDRNRHSRDRNAKELIKQPVIEV